MNNTLYFTAWYNLWKMYFVPLIALIALFLLLLPFSVAQTIDESFYEQTGLTEDALQGCESCMYSEGTLTLASGATVTLSSFPSDLIIDTNGGTVVLPTGDTISSGSLDTTTMTLSGGTLEFTDSSSALASPLDLRFEESTIKPSAAVSLVGTGTIVDGKIYLIEKGEVTITGSSPVFVENLKEPTVVTEQFTLDGNTIGSTTKPFLTGKIDSSTKIGTETDYIRITEGEGTFYYRNGFLSCSDSCNYDVTGNPNLNIKGSGLQFDPVMNKKTITSYQTTRLNTRTVSFQGSEQHVFEGNVYAAENSIFFAKQSAATDIIPEVVQSVDGRYISTDKAPVQIFFDTDVVAAGNYIIIDGTTTLMNGNGYSVAFGDVGGGNPDSKFPYSFTEQGPFDDQRPDSSFRLMVTMSGGTVSASPEQIQVTQPGVTIVNGVNKITYADADIARSLSVLSGIQVPEDELIHAFYKYNACYQEPPGEGLHASCGELAVPMKNGGTINVVTGEGEKPTEPRDVDFTFRTELTGRQDYDLNTGEIYVLGYKGGEAAEALVGEKEAGKEWGHAGLLYYKHGKWWVAEEDGVALRISPVDDSLFAGKLDGVYQVETEYPQAIIDYAEENAGTDYKHFSFPYVDDIGAPGMTCSGFCTMALEETPDIKNAAAGRINFKLRIPLV